MAYQVKTSQNEVTISCKLGVFVFKQDQVVESKLGKQLALYFPNIFVPVESEDTPAPVIPQTPVAPAPVEVPVEPVIVSEPVAATPEPEAPVEEPVVEPEGTEDEMVSEQEDSGEVAETSTTEVTEEDTTEVKKSNAGRKPKKR
jgi:hypothetical protein